LGGTFLLDFFLGQDILEETLPTFSTTTVLLLSCPTSGDPDTLWIAVQAELSGIQLYLLWEA